MKVSVTFHFMSQQHKPDLKSFNLYVSLFHSCSLWVHYLLMARSLHLFPRASGACFNGPDDDL
jgi:hypothetical protein